MNDQELVGLEPWDDEDPDPDQLQLGPVRLGEAFNPITVLTGKPVEVFVNNAFDLGGYEGKVYQMSPGLLLLELEIACATRDIVTAMVSDGYTSHSIAPTKLVADENGDLRFYYFDPWNVASFLQDGNNIASVQARSESNGVYSVTLNEFERVIVAIEIGRMESNERKRVIDLASLSAGREQVSAKEKLGKFADYAETDLYTFFNLRETQRTTRPDGRVSIAMKTGGFKKYVDVELLISPGDYVESVIVEVAQRWVTDGPNVMFAADIVKSFMVEMGKMQEAADLMQRVAHLLMHVARYNDSFKARLSRGEMLLRKVHHGPDPWIVLNIVAS